LYFRPQDDSIQQTGPCDDWREEEQSRGNLKPLPWHCVRWVCRAAWVRDVIDQARIGGCEFWSRYITQMEIGHL